MSEAISTELRLADAEHSAWLARMAELRGRALDRSLDRETRLAALLAYDAEIWRVRQGKAESAVDTTPDKIELAKRASERKRLDQVRASRIAAGLPVRPRRNLKTIINHGESAGSQPCTPMRLRAVPGARSPGAETLTSDDPTGSRSRAREHGPRAKDKNRIAS